MLDDTDPEHKKYCNETSTPSSTIKRAAPVPNGHPLFEAYCVVINAEIMTSCTLSTEG